MSKYAKLVAIYVINEIISVSLDRNSSLPPHRRRNDYKKKYGVLVSVDELPIDAKNLANLLVKSENGEIIYPDSLVALEQTLNKLLKNKKIKAYVRRSIKNSLELIAVEKRYDAALKSKSTESQIQINIAQRRKRAKYLIPYAIFNLILSPPFYCLVGAPLTAYNIYQKTKIDHIHQTGIIRFFINVAILLFQIPRAFAIIGGIFLGSLYGLVKGVFDIPSLIRDQLRKIAPSPIGDDVQKMMKTLKTGKWEKEWKKEREKENNSGIRDAILNGDMKVQTASMKHLHSRIILTLSNVGNLPNNISITNLKNEIIYYLQHLETIVKEDNPPVTDDLDFYHLKLNKYRDRYSIKEINYKKENKIYLNADDCYILLNEIVKNLATSTSEKDVATQTDKLKDFVKSEQLQNLHIPVYSSKNKQDVQGTVMNPILSNDPRKDFTQNNNNSNNITASNNSSYNKKNTRK